ncbi:MAG: hypothetical protein E6J91_09010 [Deltaproteobacteria bacterium]|nr:MAG: hypothetical protein E6J91_09010 [Deltaproteobacteria bacterium]
MKRVVVALGCALPGLAAAEPHKLLVLQPEGRADAALRTRIDAAIVKLAATAGLQATAGELTFSDAATAVGCRPDVPACKDEVLDMLAVDEIAITTVTPKPGGVEIAVQRVARGTSREASMLLATGAPPDKLDGIAPLFTDKPVPAASPPAAPTPPAIAATPPAGPAAIPPPTAVALAPQPVPEMTPTASPAPPPEQPAGNRRLELVGMAGGAGMAVLGLVLWGAASGIQDDIDHAPTATRQDLANLRDLESRGDTYAALGNVLAVSGLVVGGIATYLYIRDRRAGSTASARLSPTVLDHGAGLVLTIGAAP